MQITIDLPPDLEQDLIRQAHQSNIPLQTLILETLRAKLQKSSKAGSEWPELILNFESVPDFPKLESYRDELIPPCEPELF